MTMEYGLYLDVERCSGCQSCAVACMDQNDIDVDTVGAWRHVYRVERGRYPDAAIMHVSLACLHCADAPCVMACPTGAIHRADGSPAVVTDPARCVGCHSCLLACPFGAPRFGRDGKMQKCDLCADRVAAGLEPACVRVCPTKALQFGSLDDVAARTAARHAQRLVVRSGS